MSSMLEQAIIDASALKEAALKNAEQEVLERYSKDIKEAVDALLEQDDDLEPMEEPKGAAPTPQPEEEVLDDIPMAFAGGEKLCPCPDDDEVVELDLDQLMVQSSEEEPSADEMADREELALDIEDEEELRGMVQEVIGSQKNDEIELDEQELLDIVEELVFEN